MLVECAADVGLDVDRFIRLYAAGAGQPGFERDMAEKQLRGIRGFPILLFSHPWGGEASIVRGARSWEELEASLMSILRIQRRTSLPTPADALAGYGCGTTREFASLLELDDDQTERVLAASGAQTTVFGRFALWHQA